MAENGKKNRTTKTALWGFNISEQSFKPLPEVPCFSSLSVLFYDFLFRFFEYQIFILNAKHPNDFKRAIAYLGLPGFASGVGC